MAEENIGNLEKEALKRKEKLKALKRKHTDTENSNNSAEQTSIQLPKYVVH